MKHASVGPAAPSSLFNEDVEPDVEKGLHQNVRRFLAIINLLSSASGTGLRPIDVANSSGLDRATAHRLLGGLVGRSVAEVDAESRRYFIGRKVLDWSLSARNRYGIAEAAYGALQELADATGDTAYLALRTGKYAYCVDSHEGSFPIRAQLMQVGERKALASGVAGLAILTFLDEVEIARVLDEHTATDDLGTKDQTIRRQIETTRTNGYATDKGFLLPGISAVAVPIFDVMNDPVASICVSAISTRLNASRRDQISRMLLATAKTVQDRIEASST